MFHSKWIFVILAYQFFPCILYGSDKITVSCNNPIFSKVESKKNIYNFSVKMTCYPKIESNTFFYNVVNRYQMKLQESRNIKIKNIVENIIRENMRGKMLSIEEKIYTDEGNLKTKAQLYLLSNSRDKFTYEMRTTEVTGSGNAGNTKQVSEKFQLEKKTGDHKILLQRELLIRKPSIVPKSFFIKKVKEGIASDMKDSVFIHLKRISYKN
ncbi:MAG: hypothetical protein CMP11_03560 [Zetaproteobacteria bacterium]|nr:hypothetical protein [Pseudobdellovibrionaceae bacterium]